MEVPLFLRWGALMTLRELALQVYLPSHPYLTKSSLRSLRYALNRWEEATENRDLQDIGATDAYRFIEHFRHLAPDTLRGYLTWPRLLLRHAAEVSLIASAPRFPRIRCRRKFKPTPTLVDAGKMFRVAPEAGLTWPTFENPAHFWRRWIVVSYFTGLRLSDMMLGVSRECMRSDALVIEAQKTGKVLAVPICRLLRESLTSPKDSDSRIFPVSNSPHLVRRELRTLATAAGVSVPVTPHGLRRLSITEWTSASDAAGRIVHGCGVSGVIASYLNVLRPLQRARELLQVPPEFYGGLADDRQLRLF